MFMLTLIIILTVFLLDLGLSILNYRYRNQPIPDNVKEVYDPEAYRKWLRYTMENHRLSLVVKTVHLLVLLAFFFWGLFPILGSWVIRFSADPIIRTLLFLGMYTFFWFLIGVGFSWYRVFSIEERYGFNRSTPGTFVADQLKSALILLLLGGGLLYGLLWLYLQMETRFILYTWISAVLVLLAMNLVYAPVIIRLFNTLSPLPDGPLKERILALAANTGYGIKKISVLDASRRSTKMNAFVSGFGKFKHIVLFDTLLDKCSADQVISVLAHEIGHIRHKDTLRNLLLSMIQLAGYLFVLNFFLSYDPLYDAFGFTGVHLGFALLLFRIFMEPLEILLGIPLSALSRRAEYRADRFAAATGYRQSMIDALKVLARENYAHLTPHPWLVRMTYSHPPISERIQALSDGN